MPTFFSTATRVALSAASVALALAGCTPDQTEPTPTSGKLDFTKYLAVGDSYTAGYSDGGLTLASQQYSYASLLARQFALVNPEAKFTQPLLEDGAGTGFLSLVNLDENGLPRTRRVKPASTRGRFINAAGCNGADTTYLYPRATSTLPQNLGVPGLRLSQIAVAGLGNEANLNRINQFNPYFERLLPAGDNRTYLQTVTVLAPGSTFFTFFAGVDDMLPYVVSGGACGPLPVGTTLAQNARQILLQLTAGGRSGIIALPPSLVTLPILRLNNALTVQQRRQAAIQRPDYTLYVRAFNGAVQAASPDDYILPSGQRRLGRLEQVVVNGTTQTVAYGDQLNPVSGADVLDYIEYGRIAGAMTQFRDELTSLNKSTFKLPLLDTNDAVFNQINEQININGVLYTPELVRGNFYSLDQFSLTPRGNAILANAFLREINKSYGSSIPLLNPNNLPTSANP